MSNRQKINDNDKSINHMIRLEAKSSRPLEKPEDDVARKVTLGCGEEYQVMTY